MQPRFFQSTRSRELTGKSYKNEQSTLDWRAKCLITTYEELSAASQHDCTIFITKLHSLGKLGSLIARQYLVTCSTKLAECSEEKFKCIISCLQDLSNHQYYPEVVCALSILHFTYPAYFSGETEEVYSVRQGVSYLKRAAFDHSPETVKAAHQLVALYSTHKIARYVFPSLLDYYCIASCGQQITSDAIPLKKSIAILEDYARASCHYLIEKLTKLYSTGICVSITGAADATELRDENKAAEWANYSKQAEKHQDELLSKYLINAIHVTLKFANSLSRHDDQHSLSELIKMYGQLHKMDLCQETAFRHRVKTQLIAYANEGYARSCMHLSGWYYAGSKTYNVVKSDTSAAFWQRRAIENGICHDRMADIKITSHLVDLDDSQIEDNLLLLAYKSGSRIAALELAKEELFKKNNLSLTYKYTQSLFGFKLSYTERMMLHVIATSDSLNKLSDELRSHSIRWLGLTILNDLSSSVEFIESNLRMLEEFDLSDKWQMFSDGCKKLTYPEVYHQIMNELVSETILALENKNRLINSLRR